MWLQHTLQEHYSMRKGNNPLEYVRKQAKLSLWQRKPQKWVCLAALRCFFHIICPLTFSVGMEGIITALKSVVGREKQRRGICLLPQSVCVYTLCAKSLPALTDKLKRSRDQRETMQIKKRLDCRGKCVWLQILPRWKAESEPVRF